MNEEPMNMKEMLKNIRELTLIHGYQNFAMVSRDELFSLQISDPLVCLFGTDMIPSVRNRPIEGQTILGDQCLPNWFFDDKPYQPNEIYAVRFKSCYINPSWGAVMPSLGMIFEPSIKAALYKSPNLLQIPRISLKDGKPAIDIGRITRRTLDGDYLVLNHWGGHNYGHFLFDSLPGVMLFYKEILHGKLKILSAPLKGWQKELLEILAVPENQIKIIHEDYCLCEGLIWPSFLYDNLNQPSQFTRVVGDYLRMLAPDNPLDSSPKYIYISRRNISNRRLLNEADLVKRLENFGFTVICPEDYSVKQQITIFSGAKVIVGEIGAGFANAMFAPTSCKIIEIMPEIKPSFWIRRFCSLLNMEWYCFYAKVLPDQRTISVIDGVEYKNLVFSYYVNVDQVMRLVERAFRA